MVLLGTERQGYCGAAGNREARLLWCGRFCVVGTMVV